MSQKQAKLIRKTLNNKIQLEMHEYLVLLLAMPFWKRAKFCLKLLLGRLK